ncbi:hypothetical protein EIN_060980 [Entamoeba invadens IP1]|uniref:hypothetical protein n=1 Tax=Entamoeba invadens IP1 TaxID=370355 RepID=UPI0002C3F7EC|nr:hypothetical protein EIN_060980 [Entamoeba invadens IP1]ELP93533.1 hypothetical protein EIN_060980 [Entamoeba invadens IP1]|eukprot:XP_004260304.1 hypothetical protein EIN_060980 [Entamoeba invadens IP1]
MESSEVKRGRHYTISSTFTRFLSRSRDSLVHKNTITEEDLSLKIIASLSTTFNYFELLQLFGDNGYTLFDSPDEVLSEKSRSIVWRMSNDKRTILELLCKKMKEENIPAKQLMYLAFDRKTILPSDCEIFVNDLMKNQDTIFNVNGDPLYDFDGNVLTLSLNVLYEMLFNFKESKKIVSTVVITHSLFSTRNELLTHILQEHDELQKMKESHVLVKMKERLDYIITTYAQFLGPLPKAEIDLIKSTFNKNELPKIFETDSVEDDKVPSRLCKSKKSNKKRLSLRSDPGDVAQVLSSEGEIDKFLNLDTEITKETLTNIHHRLVAQQFVAFDSNYFNKIEKEDWVLGEKSDNVKKWVHATKTIESCVFESTPTRKQITFFVKVMNDCLEMREMNICNIIFSVLVNLSIQKQ